VKNGDGFSSILSRSSNDHNNTSIMYLLFTQLSFASIHDVVRNITKNEICVSILARNLDMFNLVQFVLANNKKIPLSIRGCLRLTMKQMNR
jgi:hypothetical protein